MQEKKEMNGQGFTRRQFVKGAIMSAAGVSLLSILPGCGAAASSPAASGAQPEAKAAISIWTARPIRWSLFAR